MLGSSRPSANHSAPGLVVVGCASEDAESLHEALDALRRDGLEVELCAGLDQDPRRLSDVIDRHQSRGLYVLCRSPALGRERVEELREILLARHVPFARTLTVAVGGRGTLADRIRSGLRRASARNTGPNRAVGSGGGPPLEDEEPTLVGRRDALGVPEELGLVPSSPMRLPSRGPSPVAASTQGPELGGEDEVDDDDGDVDVGDGAGEPELLEDTNASWSGAAIASLDLSDLDEGNTGRARMPPGDVTAPGPMPALITGDTVIGPAPAMITGDTVVGQRLSRIPRDPSGRLVLPPLGPAPQVGTPPPTGRRPAAELEPATTPFPRLGPEGALPSLPPSPAATPSPSPPFAAASTLPPPSTASTLPPPSAAAPSPSQPPAAAPSLPPSPALAPSMPPPPAPMSAMRPAPPPLAPSSPAAWASSAGASAAGASASGGASATSASFSYDDAPIPARSKVLPFALGGVALLLLALVIALALSNEQGTPEVASGGDDAPASDDAATPSPTPTQTSPTPPDAKADEAPAEPTVYPVVVALQARKVRALDVLLIANAWGKPSDWATAVAYCEALDVEGLTGWRLPHIGELHSLAEASMTGRGMYWSSTAADTFGDGHMAWNARRGHALPHFADAVAICVRGGASGS